MIKLQKKAPKNPKPQKPTKKAIEKQVATGIRDFG
tara:strand:- start:1131 stop:1235 length:105 start_codon:yes stop_codon:yes gene_type:complete